MVKPQITVLPKEDPPWKTRVIYRLRSRQKGEGVNVPTLIGLALPQGGDNLALGSGKFSHTNSSVDTGKLKVRKEKLNCVQLYKSNTNYT